MTERNKTSLAGLFVAATICCAVAAAWVSRLDEGVSIYLSVAAASFVGALLVPYSIAAGIAAGTAMLGSLGLIIGTDPLGPSLEECS